MSLVKIPFLLLSTLSLQVGMTPPNRPPPPTEQYIPDKGKRAAHTGEVILRRILTAGGPVTYFKMMFWIAFILESLVIISSTYGGAPVFNRILLIHPTPDSITRITRPTYTFLLCAVLIVIGGIIRVHCFRTLGASFTFELSVQKDQKLITSGLYSVVRHPSYTGAAISVGFAALQQLSRGSWVRESGILDNPWGRPIMLVWFGGMAIMIGTLMMRIKSEDEILQKEFGDKWEKWREDVPYRLFPGVY
ncbi:hypothetical protein E1B28_006313 [Marasmius oreades]|uniref:Protein-S-isoprenylcysteine O-methyltransferase n=1 Tax=Marasmius oreades TaxID=181124 RepID=A0A9P7UV51_9AGAR|nr:uncharacterized protein E1B28_006313 [Marasmius oreades]KAG7095582.1 hypothetical protein E1B28_006313 [Marasmius oreades]